MARVSFAEILLLLLVVLYLMINAEAAEKRTKNVRRMKREWILPPTKLKENTVYSHLDFIAKIRSDKDKDEKVEYYLSGPGADKPPFNLFVVDHDTGFVKITDKLDREKHSSFHLKGLAKYKNGSIAEEEIPLTVIVLDENDNPPYFELHSGNITESSKKGTFVMQIVGKDDDQNGTINAQISYSIISQEPKGTGHMFTIDEKTGKLYVKDPTLDRETHDFYKLVVKGTDMGGAPGGQSGTGTVEIKVLDINDNIPTLEKSEYSGSVDENVADVVVMKIKALDKDLAHTDNWLTVFTIAKGNEDNLFSIETDKKTNEGILKLIKKEYHKFGQLISAKCGYFDE